MLWGGQGPDTPVRCESDLRPTTVRCVCGKGDGGLSTAVRITMSWAPISVALRSPFTT